ncbi:MAG TPA: alpha/beta fold hydrolase, partial [Acidimicrobiales bacterium]|nr:alpha/beta fold hydrolase [Acidimicrobiales bacterium]
MIEVGPGVRLAVDVWPAAVGTGRGDEAPAALRAPEPAPAAFLLVHGLASNARLWDGVAESLAGRGHACAAVDQRGHGRSDKPDDGYDLATACSDLRTVLASLRAGTDGFEGPVVVVGQSWGATVVLELAYRHPDEVAAVVCV